MSPFFDVVKDFFSKRAGGCFSLQFSDMKYLDTFTTINNNVKIIIFKSIYRFYNLECTFLEFSESSALKQNGIQYSTKIKGIITDQTNDIELLLVRMSNAKHIIKCLDNKGNERICTNMQFTWDYTTGTKAGERNAYTFEFNCTSKQKAFFSNNVLVVENTGLIELDGFSVGEQIINLVQLLNFSIGKDITNLVQLVNYSVGVNNTVRTLYLNNIELSGVSTGVNNTVRNFYLNNLELNGFSIGV